MKITEPKTPYVRYNALTDEVENLGGACAPTPCSRRSSIQTSPPSSSSPAAARPARPPRPPRRPSPTSPPAQVPAAARAGATPAPPPAPPPSASPQTPSAASAPALSPSAARSRRRRRTCRPKVRNPVLSPLQRVHPPAAAAKHAAFVRARGRHYSNEAEAMKVSPRPRSPRRAWDALVHALSRLPFRSSRSG